MLFHYLSPSPCFHFFHPESPLSPFFHGRKFYVCVSTPPSSNPTSVTFSYSPPVSVCLSLSASLRLSLPICLSLSVSISVYLLVCLSVCLCFSVPLYPSLFVCSCLFLSLSRPVSVSVCVSVSLIFPRASNESQCYGGNKLIKHLRHISIPVRQHNLSLKV